MKKLNTNKLTDKQADLFKNNLVYIATVDENGNPQVGPKRSEERRVGKECGS